MEATVSAVSLPLFFFFWSLGWHARERREEAVAATHKKIVEGTHWALEARSGEIGECR